MGTKKGRSKCHICEKMCELSNKYEKEPSWGHVEPSDHPPEPVFEMTREDAIKGHLAWHKRFPKYAGAKCEHLKHSDLIQVR